MSGETLHGKVLRAVNGGYGLLQIDGQTVFARNALKGEDVTVAIRSKRKGVLFGEAASVETRHEGRREAPCPVASRCGGCHYQIAGPGAQEEAKKEALAELLGRAHIDLPISRWHSGPEFGWRARVELHGARLEEAFTLGFFEERSHRVVPAAGCLQVSERMRTLIDVVVKALSAGGIKSGSVEIAESFSGPGLVLVASEPSLTSVLRRHSHELGLSGLALKTSKNEAATIYGDARIENKIAGVTLHHSVMSFFQANRFMTETLLQAVMDRAAVTLDGVTSIELNLADPASIDAAVAEALAVDDNGSTDRLYAEEAGETAASLLAGLMDDSTPGPSISLTAYPEFYRSLIAGTAVRERRPVHPRLSIWGPFEARLQQPDVVVLGSLNEGTWPEAADPGPWLNRPMRAMLGLPSPEEKVGYSALDFTTLLGADKVYLTRALKIDGVPTVPSRWLMRFSALLQGLGLEAEQRRNGAERFFAAQGHAAVGVGQHGRQGS